MKRARSLFTPRTISKALGLGRKRRRPYKPFSLEYIAVHEAGHAVSAVVLGLPLKAVDIRRHWHTDSIDDLAGKGEAAAMPHIIRVMSGIFAEARVNEAMVSNVPGPEDHPDLKRALGLATAAFCKLFTRDDICWDCIKSEILRNGEFVVPLYNSALEAAKGLLEDHWAAVRTVADLLLERGRLTGEEVAALVGAS